MPHPEPPPGAAGPPPALRAAVDALLDFVGVGASILSRGDWPLTGLTRQTILLALARRALVTATGVAALGELGLLEPTLATMRTLLELEMRAVAIAADPSDDAAKMQVAWSYVHAKSVQTALLNDLQASGELDAKTRARIEAADLEIDAALARKCSTRSESGLWPPAANGTGSQACFRRAANSESSATTSSCMAPLRPISTAQSPIAMSKSCQTVVACCVRSPTSAEASWSGPYLAPFITSAAFS